MENILLDPRIEGSTARETCCICLSHLAMIDVDVGKRLRGSAFGQNTRGDDSTRPQE